MSSWIARSGPKVTQVESTQKLLRLLHRNLANLNQIEISRDGQKWLPASEVYRKLKAKAEGESLGIPAHGALEPDSANGSTTGPPIRYSRFKVALTGIAAVILTVCGIGTLHFTHSQRTGEESLNVHANESTQTPTSKGTEETATALPSRSQPDERGSSPTVSDNSEQNKLPTLAADFDPSLLSLLRFLKQSVTPDDGLDFLIRDKDGWKTVYGYIQSININSDMPNQSVFQLTTRKIEEGTLVSRKELKDIHREIKTRDIAEIGHGTTLISIRGDEYQAIIFPDLKSKSESSREWRDSFVIHSQEGANFVFGITLQGLQGKGIGRWLPGNRFSGHVLGIAQENVCKEIIEFERNRTTGYTHTFTYKLDYRSSEKQVFYAAHIQGQYDSLSKRLTIDWQPTEDFFRYRYSKVIARKSNASNFPDGVSETKNLYHISACAIPTRQMTETRPWRRESNAGKKSGHRQEVNETYQLPIGDRMVVQLHQKSETEKATAAFFNVVGREVSVLFTKHSIKFWMQRLSPETDQEVIHQVADDMGEAIRDFYVNSKRYPEIEELLADLKKQYVRRQLPAGDELKLLELYFDMELDYRSQSWNLGINSNGTKGSYLPSEFNLPPELTRDFNIDGVQQRMTCYDLDDDANQLCLIDANGKRTRVEIPKLKSNDQKWLETTGRKTLGRLPVESTSFQYKDDRDFLRTFDGDGLTVSIPQHRNVDLAKDGYKLDFHSYTEAQRKTILEIWASMKLSKKRASNYYKPIMPRILPDAKKIKL